MFFLLMYLPAGFRLYRYIKKNGIDIVHFSDIIDAPFYPIAKIAGAKIVAHVRVCAGGAAVRYLFRLWTTFFCSRIITVSKFVKDYYGFDDKRASVVYNPGPDRTIFAIDKREQNAADTTPTVLTVASFRRDKGHHNFLKIASKIKDRLNTPIKFVIAGGKVKGHENYYREMTVYAHSLGLDGSLTITGNIPHEQIPSIMAEAAVLLHVPDWEEALGGVILEAMAMGVAIVAYDSGGVGECFTNDNSGFLIGRGRIDDAVDKTVLLLTDNSLKDRIVSEAHKDLDAKFSMARYIGGVEKIYDDIRRVRALF
jgi:glycosyltransferase involved in cell wall biosynthesis